MVGDRDIREKSIVAAANDRVGVYLRGNRRPIIMWMTKKCIKIIAAYRKLVKQVKTNEISISYESWTGGI